MKPKQLKAVREALEAAAEVVAMTHDPNDTDEPHPDYSAADVFEAVCNIAFSVQEALAIVRKAAE